MSAIGQQLIDIVRAKAAEDPDFIYTPPGGSGAPCVYVHDGRPSCLIGHALWGAGLIDAAFEHRPGGTFPPNEDGLLMLVDRLDLDLDPDELSWLIKVQSEQDEEAPWGRAVEETDWIVSK